MTLDARSIYLNVPYPFPTPPPFPFFLGAFIDQSQSLNAFVSEPDYDKLTSMHFHGWKRGLKTGKLALKSSFLLINTGYWNYYQLVFSFK